MENQINYANLTYNSKNNLARFSHRKRMKIGESLILNHKVNSILDYGSGDNKFLKDFHDLNNTIELFAFEPILVVEEHEAIKTFKDLKEIGNLKFDVICCFEVLEHFNSNEQNEIINNLHKLLSPNGTVLISIPIEIGPPSLIKNLIRLRNNMNIKFLKNMTLALFGLENKERKKSCGYIYPHIGFDHRPLEKSLAVFFKIELKTTSPFQNIPVFFNSQIFYKLIKKT